MRHITRAAANKGQSLTMLSSRVLGPGKRPLRASGSGSDGCFSRAFSAESSRVARTLYRQLLRWCQAHQAAPLSGFLAAPIHIRAPEQVDPYRMEVLAQQQSSLDDRTVRFARSCLPRRTDIQRSQMTVPVHSAADLQGFFRSLYRLNSEDSDHQKSRVSLAFEALKSLNELTTALRSLDERRQAHVDREGVEFRVGSIVQHKHDRWRGVVASWERTTDEKLPDSRSSLTSKSYDSHVDNSIRYEVILDDGDAHMMGSSSGRSTAIQADLLPVTDESLVRVRSRSAEEAFVRFDNDTQSFVPSELKAYEYPSDSIELQRERSFTEEERATCQTIVDAVEAFARQLERVILDETSCAGARRLDLLDKIHTRISDLIKGNVLPTSLKYAPTDPSPSAVAANHLRQLLSLSLEIFDVLYHRRQSLEHRHKIKFGLGDIVHHKVFGFRGVVVAWDPKPTVDVSKWDGLQHLEGDPMEMPFYHVVPDQNDCVEAFGGERPFRYVCEENLEPCPANRALIDVDLAPEWQRNPSRDTFDPPLELRFKYGQDMDDDGVTERCFKRLQSRINDWQLQARQNEEGNAEDEATLTMNNLLAFLKVADTLSDAAAAQEMVKEVRKAHANLDLRWRLDTGVAELMSGKGESALAVYQTVIDQEPDTYPEALNKIATCQFMLGKLDESLVSTLRVLELDPLHFQALNGLGLIYFEKGDYKAAIDVFRKSVSIDPWSPVSSKLSVCVDLVDRTIDRSELP